MSSPNPNDVPTEPPERLELPENLELARRPHALLGVVLAGGRSSRMGVDKAILPHRTGPGTDHSGNPAKPGGAAPPGGPCEAPVTYLDFALDRLRPLVVQVAVSGRTIESLRFLANPAGVIAIPDQTPFAGPADGVAESLRLAVSNPAVASPPLAGILVTPVDMPDLTMEHLSLLVDAWTVSGETSIVAATFADSRPEPLVAIYPAASMPAIAAVASSKSRSLYRWLVEQPCVLVPLPVAGSRNVNRPEER
jgi:molybdenum cofactor guanylyltransferase